MEAGSALLIMAISGGALIPQLFAYLKHVIDFQLAFLLLMVPSYAYIWYFAARGYRTREELSAAASGTVPVSV
jgi:fucose permease